MWNRSNKTLENLVKLQEQIQELELELPNSLTQPTKSFPLIDMYESDDTLEVKIYIPEFEKNEIELGIDDLILDIHAHKKDIGQYQSIKYLIKESRSVYQRNISLPNGARPKELKATYENNILILDIPYQKSTLFKVKIN